MGASGWSYRISYDPDIEAALRRLQQEVFERGEYHKPWVEFWRHREALLAKPRDQLEERERQYLDMLPMFTPDRDYVPDSIEELLRNNAESGTHSILDISGIADEPTFGAATPVPDDQLLLVFGTTQPTPGDVEAVVDHFMGKLPRWEAVYFIVYEGGRPKEIHFVGRSGD
jgi:hypothetical protein